MWLVCFFASSGICSSLILRSIQDYLKYDVVTHTTTQYEIPTKFPTVSICHSVPFMTKQGIDYAKKISQDNNLTIENSNLLGIFFQRYFIVSNLKNYSYSDEFRKNTSFSIDEMLVGCYYNFEVCKAEQFEWFFDPWNGNCFKFNSGRNSTNHEISDSVANKPGIKIKYLA
jgi:hypothetical protein